MSASVPEGIQKEIRAVLLSKVGGVKLNDFQRDFKALNGNKLDARSFGFPGLKALFESIPAVAKVIVDPKDNSLRVFGVQSGSMMYVNATAKRAEFKPRQTNLATATRNTTADGASQSRGNENIEVFFGNLPEDATEVEVSELIKEFDIRNIRFKASGQKRFSFLTVPSVAVVDQLIEAFHLKHMRGKRIIVQQSNKDPAHQDPPVAPPASRSVQQSNRDPPHQDPPAAAPDSRSVHPGLLSAYQNDMATSKAGSRERLSANLAAERGGSHYVPLERQQHGLSAARGPLMNLEQVAVSGRRQTELEEVEDFPPDLEMPPLEDVVEQSIHARQSGAPTLTVTRNLEDTFQQTLYVRDEDSHMYPNPYHPEGKETFDLYVANFPLGTSYWRLLEYFGPLGAHYVQMQNNNDPQRRTYAFVAFNDYDQAASAMSLLDGVKIDGRVLAVSFGYNTFAPEEVVRQRLVNVRCTVKVTGGRGGPAGPRDTAERVVTVAEAEAEADDDEHYPDAAGDHGNEAGAHRWGYGQALANGGNPGTARNPQYRPGVGPAPHTRHDTRANRGPAQRPRTQSGSESGARMRPAPGGGRDGYESSGSNKENYAGPRHPEGGQQQRYGGGRQHPGGDPHGTMDRQQQFRGGPQNTRGDGHRPGGAPQRSVGDPQRSGSDPPHRPEGVPQRSGGDPPHRPGGVPQRSGGDPPHRPGGVPQRSGGDPQRSGGDPPHRAGGDPRHYGGGRPQPGGQPQRPETCRQKVPPTMESETLRGLMETVCHGSRPRVRGDFTDTSMGVLVTEVVDGHFFWGWPLNQKEELEKFQALQEVMKVLTAESLAPYDNSGRAMAQFMDDWCRVWVRRIHQGMADILYADFGNVATVPVSEVYSVRSNVPMGPFLWVLNPMIVPFKTADTNVLHINEGNPVELEEGDGNDLVLKVRAV